MKTSNCPEVVVNHNDHFTGFNDIKRKLVPNLMIDIPEEAPQKFEEQEKEVYQISRKQSPEIKVVNENEDSKITDLKQELRNLIDLHKKNNNQNETDQDNTQIFVKREVTDENRRIKPSLNDTYEEDRQKRRDIDDANRKAISQKKRKNERENSYSKRHIKKNADHLRDHILLENKKMNQEQVVAVQNEKDRKKAYYNQLAKQCDERALRSKSVQQKEPDAEKPQKEHDSDKPQKGFAIGATEIQPHTKEDLMIDLKTKIHHKKKLVRKLNNYVIGSFDGQINDYLDYKHLKDIENERAVSKNKKKQAPVTRDSSAFLREQRYVQQVRNRKNNEKNYDKKLDKQEIANNVRAEMSYDNLNINQMANQKSSLKKDLEKQIRDKKKQLDDEKKQKAEIYWTIGDWDFGQKFTDFGKNKPNLVLQNYLRPNFNQNEGGYKNILTEKNRLDKSTDKSGKLNPVRTVNNDPMSQNECICPEGKDKPIAMNLNSSKERIINGVRRINNRGLTLDKENIF